MSQPNGHAEPLRMSELFRAIVVSLRQAHQLLRALVNDNHPSVVGHPDTTVVLTDGLRVADALEAIAQRLEAQEQA